MNTRVAVDAKPFDRVDLSSKAIKVHGFAPANAALAYCFCIEAVARIAVVSQC